MDDTMETEVPYSDVLHEVSKKWLTIQLRHEFSQHAVNEFWSVAITDMKRLFEVKQQQRVSRKIPQFINQRNKLYRDLCPKVKMNFGYLHKATEEVYTLSNLDKAPVHRYDKDPSFIKLYEVAYVKVNKICLLYTSPSPRDRQKSRMPSSA